MPSTVSRRGLEVGQSGAVRVLTLSRPEARNAIDAELREALADGLAGAATDDDVGAVVIAGAGGTFCAGGDLGAFDLLHDPRAYRYRSHGLTDLFESIERLEKPVVAALEGAATGAGLALALACDWRVGGPHARILFREGRVGLVPTHGGLTRLVKLVGLARAKEAMLGGDDLDLEAAREAGLISEVAAEGEATSIAVARAGQMASARAPLSFAAAKRLLVLAADADGRSSVLAESLAQASLLQSSDHREGLAAVRERRPPRFEGR
jgi:enoyl-CoA hydratase/carnithine racemase